jgi:dihydroorotase
LLFNGYIHDGVYAKEHGHRGICSASEYKQVERDLKLVKETGVSYHVCHVSTKESVDLIRKAKREGLDVTCETAPHYLILTDSDLKEEGRFKMNPPLRSEEDRKALIEGILDGTVDMIATDHAPHSEEEKSKGLEKSAFGIVGIETAFPLLYTHLVKTKILTIEKLVELLSVNPRKRFGVKNNGYAVFEIETPYTIDQKEFLSKGKSTPFLGEEVYGRCVLTVMDGKVVYHE